MPLAFLCCLSLFEALSGNIGRGTYQLLLLRSKGLIASTYIYYINIMILISIYKFVQNFCYCNLDWLGR